MTERSRKIDAITDSMFYYMTELTSLASDLEDLGFEKDGLSVRDIVGDIENIARRIMNRKHKQKRSA